MTGQAYDNSSVPFSLLMEKIGLANYYELKTLLKANRLPIIPDRKPVSLPLANKILTRLRGTHISTRELRAREYSTDGYAIHQIIGSLPDDLLTFALEKLSRATLRLGDAIYGVGIQGGHFGALRQSLFTFSLNEGVHFLIGDRGSGKSTILNAAAATVGITGHQTAHFLSNLIGNTEESHSTPEAALSGATSFLRHYSADALALVYARNGTPYCLFVSRREGHGLFTLTDNRLRSTPLTTENLPDCQIFRQGDIFRIADQEDQNALHSLLDSFNQTLARLRLSVHRRINNVASQFSAKSSRLYIDDMSTIHTTMNHYFRLLDSISHAGPQGLIGVANDMLDELRRMQTTVLGHDGLSASLDGFVGELIFVPIEVEIDRLCSRACSSSLSPQSTRNIRDELIETFGARVSSVATLIENVKSLKTLNSVTPAHARAIRSILSEMKDLIHEQTTMFSAINSVLAERNIGMSIGLFEEALLVESINSTLHACNSFQSDCDIIQNFSISNHYSIIADCVERVCMVQRIALDLATFEGASQNHPIYRKLWPDITVNIAETNKQRRFSELSFGQKCGLILVIFLLNTKAKTIFLDQPEDHLDVSAVVLLLAPILDVFRAERNFLIATHSVNLVMSLENATVSAINIRDGRNLEISTGHSLEVEILEKILETLEGGKQVFLKRLSIYSNFSDRLRLELENNDSLLQTAFRRRAIDELRNNIQPIVSDVEIMSLARHDLKNAIVDPNHHSILGLRARLSELRELLDDAFFDDLDSVIGRIGRHIEKLRLTVEQMRSLDKAPNRLRMNLLDTLTRIADQSATGRDDERRIKISIDEALDGVEIYFDTQHFEIIIRNLLENSLRATETRAIQKEEDGQEFEELVEIDCSQVTPTSIKLEIKDNGCGMTQDIVDRLYHSRCSTQSSSDHGHGALMIARLLELNGGEIRVIESRPIEPGTFTKQLLRLPLALVRS